MCALLFKGIGPLLTIKADYVNTTQMYTWKSAKKDVKLIEQTTFYNMAMSSLHPTELLPYISFCFEVHDHQIYKMVTIAAIVRKGSNLIGANISWVSVVPKVNLIRSSQWHWSHIKILEILVTNFTWSFIRLCIVILSVALGILQMNAKTQN